MTHFTRLLVLAVASLAPLAVRAGAQQKVDIRQAVTRDVYVRVNGAFASLKVSGWSRDSLALTGTLPRDARIDPPGLGGSSAPMRGVKFYVEGPPNSAATGTLELMVPAGATVWAKSGSAAIDVSGITGGLDLNIVGGSIAVSGSPRELNIESMDGAVTVNGSPTWMRVKTATGDVTMSGSCTDAGVTTVGGTVILRDGSFERTRIEAVTGSVTFAGTIARAGTLTVDTHSGTIEMALAKRSVDLEATTIAGTIENRLNSRRPIPGREGRGQELNLTLGVGDARATLRSFKGTIRLR